MLKTLESCTKYNSTSQWNICYSNMVASHGERHPSSREDAAASNQLCLRFEEHDLPPETEDLWAFLP